MKGQRWEHLGPKRGPWAGCRPSEKWPHPRKCALWQEWEPWVKNMTLGSEQAAWAPHGPWHSHLGDTGGLKHEVCSERLMTKGVQGWSAVSFSTSHLSLTNLPSISHQGERPRRGKEPRQGKKGCVKTRLKTWKLWGFPGGPVAKTPSLQCRGPGQ